ncbi:MAG: hypothetical protein ACI9DK_003284 [Vicingaceae bacterium]|jgi:hypothetical protein
MKKQIIKISYVAAKVAFVSCLVAGCPVFGVISLFTSGVLYANL